MTIQENVSLRPFNTFGFEAKARYFVEVQTPDELRNLLLDPRWKEVPKQILGGGSNVLLTQDVEALVIRIGIRGLEIIREDNEYLWLKAGAGESWHNLVLHCVQNGYAGLENLSLIPGTVGAAPMQNIGAYGVEIKDVFEELEAVEMHTADLRCFDTAACSFGYRDSVFKRALKGKYIIVSVTFRLRKQPVFHVSYGDIQKTLADMNVQVPSIEAISEAVIRIRQSKLPDPAVIGNAGSFFKNPEIPQAQYEALRERFPELPGYATAPDTIKVPAGWLIEKAGWKGYREGAVGVHARQALVLVHHGGGTGQQIRDLAEKIQRSIEEKFGIRLSPEVNFL
ncbi:UDP-N-acetylmuramate dehydrogenase [Rhabdobacter roseus]|uniref:UDP-N-acetylenolpyruvoylglucosamine reductase n=1 Tax=Rhabdobacter roseus TaxID=1655419 RepID=A0A840TDI3_9BACT|nr:UDP-N-acetylmuramate dehydrogenase [Rhabdobacter roseus]MBB5282166.1 UDP-N-acetylmuramate dehydrogenase [Rhabdobacter roseus]